MRVGAAAVRGSMSLLALGEQQRGVAVRHRARSLERGIDGGGRPLHGLPPAAEGVDRPLQHAPLAEVRVVTGIVVGKLDAEHLGDLVRGTRCGHVAASCPTSSRR